MHSFEGFEGLRRGGLVSDMFLRSRSSGFLRFGVRGFWGLGGAGSDFGLSCLKVDKLAWGSSRKSCIVEISRGSFRKDILADRIVVTA